MIDGDRRREIFIVGASGPLSRLAASYLRFKDQLVTLIGRSTQNVAWKPAPGFLPAPGFPPQGSVVVFFAWPTSDRRWHVQRDFSEVVDAWSGVCRDNDVRFIFISSTQASDSVASTYGRGKRLAEHRVLANNGVVLRVGLVIDDSLDTLATFIRQSSVVALLLFAVGRVPIEPVHSSDFLESLDRLLNQEEIQGRMFSCSQKPVALRVLRKPDHLSSPKVGWVLRLLVAAIARGPKVLRQVALIDGLVGLVSRADEMNHDHTGGFINLSRMPWISDSIDRAT